MYNVSCVKVQPPKFEAQSNTRTPAGKRPLSDDCSRSWPNETPKKPNWAPRQPKRGLIGRGSDTFVTKVCLMWTSCCLNVCLNVVLMCENAPCPHTMPQWRKFECDLSFKTVLPCRRNNDFHMTSIRAPVCSYGGMFPPMARVNQKLINN